MNKNESSGKWERLQDDFLFINIKDCETNNSLIKIIPEPTVDYWLTKSRDYKYPQMSMKEEDLVKYTCKYSNRELDIVKKFGLENKYFDAARQGSFRNNFGQDVNLKNQFVRNFIFNSPFVYAADFDIEDQYKNYHMDKHGRDNFVLYGKIKQSFLDIEVDQYNEEWSVNDFTGPINSITYYDSVLNTLFALELFNQPNNEQMKWVANNPDKFVEQYVKQEAHGDFKYNIQFFDTEAKLLLHFWKIIHECKPDFVGIWNMNFDIPYVLKRMDKLGLDRALACHPDVPVEYRVVKYLPDPDRFLTTEQRAKKGDAGPPHPSRLWDWVNISGYTQFYDQMALYSYIRKRGILPSYRLDDIAEAETGYGKVDYHSKGYTIRKFAHQNYILFLTYSIIDTLRLKQIEDKTGDLHKQIIFTDNTRLSKGNKVALTIKNRMFKFYWDKNPREIIGNNVWYDYFEKLDGAIVSSPKHIRIKGKGAGAAEGFIYEDVCDFDEEGLYPHIILNFNIGKESVAAKIYDIKLNDKSFSDVKNFNVKLQTIDTSIFDIGKTYFNLPNIEELIEATEQGVLKK